MRVPAQFPFLEPKVPWMVTMLAQDTTFYGLRVVRCKVCL